MFKFIKFYYGMSGSFKATTIEAEITNSKTTSIPMWSEIKSWKHWENTIFNRKNNPNNINLGLLHLCRLKDYIHNYKSIIDTTLYVERGISDMMFYWSGLNDVIENEDIIKSAVQEEEFICEQNSYYSPSKILLIQKDIDFISNVILTEPTRKECFPGGVQEYLEAQERYIEFTKKYNKITEEVIIKDAKSYVTNNLGFEFEIYPTKNH